MEVNIYTTQAVNYWAVLVAAVAYFVLGALWYSPGLFGKTWRNGVGKTDEQVKADFTPVSLVWTFIMSLLAAYGIARILSWMHAASMAQGLQVGLVAGISFAMATVWMHDAMERRPRSLTVVNSLYSIIGFVVMGLILGAWR